MNWLLITLLILLVLLLLVEGIDAFSSFRTWWSIRSELFRLKQEVSSMEAELTGYKIEEKAQDLKEERAYHLGFTECAEKMRAEMELAKNKAYEEGYKIGLLEGDRDAKSKHLSVKVFIHEFVDESLFPWGRDTIKHWATYQVFWDDIPIGGEAPYPGMNVTMKLKKREDREALRQQFWDDVEHALELFPGFMEKIIIGVGGLIKKIPPVR
ncbi:MAG: hypothetical protein ABIN66_00845 [candidate division WOR-3 bacterium]